MKKQIYLFASEIAIITGHNKFENKDKVISRLLAEYFPDENKKIIQKLESKGIEVNPIDNKKYVEKIAKKYKIDIDKSLNNTLNTKSVEDLNKCQKELVKTLEKELIKNNVSEKEKKEATKAVKSLVNTNFGTKYENNGIEMYTLENNETVIESKRFYKTKIIDTDQYEVYVGGRVDGLCYNNEGELYKIIEVKNRMYRLFYNLRDYEKIQCHIYMKLLDLKNVDLVECLKTNKETKINVIDVKFDNLFYENEIEARIFNFINYFIDIMDNLDIKYENILL